LSRKGANSPTRASKLRSTETKAKARVSDRPNSLSELKKQLEARSRELAEVRGHLSEALEQQTATAEVLRVISSSPGNLQTVFETILANATPLCEAKFGNLYLYEGGGLRTVASHNVPPAFAEARRRGLLRPAPGSPLGEVLRTKQTVHTADVAALRPYVERNPVAVAAVELGGIRTSLAVPMLKEGELIGIIAIFRQEVRPFTDKQIALLISFASQAVIAIENARLLNELRQRTDDLSESLQQQTATSEVLQVISSSPGALEPVFETMLANAARLCDAKFGTLNLYDGDAFRHGALYNVPSAYAETWWHETFRPRPGSGHAEVVRTKQVVQIDDVRATPPYREGSVRALNLADLLGVRTIVFVPMLKEGALIGTINIYRQEVRRFTDKQVALLTSFAKQAVIAIENARLLNELRVSLQQQTATADVLKVISPGARVRARPKKVGCIFGRRRSISAVPDWR